VKLEASQNVDSGIGFIGVELYWNGGATFTTSGKNTETGVTDVVFTFGGQTDLWGRTWSAADFSNANFSVRITGDSFGTTLQVDAIQVRVYHQAIGGSSGGGGAI